jgi:hypothetical protein
MVWRRNRVRVVQLIRLNSTLAGAEAPMEDML